VAGVAKPEVLPWLSIASTTYAYGVPAVSPDGAYEADVVVAARPVAGASS
jgi:hypothetical protein